VVIGLSKSIRTLSILVLITILFFATGGCSLYLLQNLDATVSTPGPDSGAEKVLCCAEEVTLAWDPPPSDIAIYKIFYRSHESGTWMLFDEIPADDDPEYTLYHGDLGNGEYDFGVVAVDAETEESAMHTSLDDTAQPESGWYLSWVL
jgi:hypothetical protein